MNRYGRSFAAGAVLAAMSTLSFAQQLAAPYTYATRYNAAGQVTGTIAPDPDLGGPIRHAATRNTYEVSGPNVGLLKTVEIGQLSAWQTEEVPPASWPNFEIFQTRVFGYDSYGRKVSERVIGRLNGTTESLIHYSYDDWDRLVCKAVRMDLASSISDACQGSTGVYGPDRITRFTYDDYDQVETEERGVGTQDAQTYVTNEYYGRGALASQKDANDNKTELVYDGNWRLHKRLYPSKTAPNTANPADYNEYIYDKNGNVVLERKRNGTTITNEYDNNNRLTFKDLSDNTYSGDVSYGYDLRGLTLYACFGSSGTSACDSSGEGETNDFDAFGNVTRRQSRMDGVTRELKYEYDLEGNRTKITHPDAYFFQYGFDGLNRFNSLRVSLAASPTSNTGSGLAIKYRSTGGRWEITRAGTNTGLTTINPDNALRLGSFVQDFTSSADDLTNTFTYNPAHQVEILDQSNTLYNYTAALNRTGSYEPNGLNQYEKVDGQTLEYDATGNLIKDRAASGALTTYTYDMENHLVAVTGAASGTLRYDVLGRLSKLVTSSGTTQFHYDGDALVGEYLNGSLHRRYVHGDQVDEPLIEYQGTNLATRRYLHADHQGSIIAHSTTLGAVTQTNAYDPYGIPRPDDENIAGNQGNEGRFGYTGQAWIKELGLNYYKARIYAPRLGRFLQTDPIFYKDDMNLYAYVGNDPANNRDPSGLKCQGTGDKSSCTIDQVNIGSKGKENWVSRSDAVKSGKVTEKQLGRLEKNILAVYKAAQKLGTSTMTVKGSAQHGIRDTKVTGDRVVMIMNDQNLRASNTPQVDGKGSATNTAASANFSSGITFWKPAFQAPQSPAGDYLQRLAAGHEPLHFVPQLGGWNNHPKEHTEPFNEAVENLIGPRP